MPRTLAAALALCLLLILAVDPALGQTPPPPPGQTATPTIGPVPTGTPAPDAMASLHHLRAALSAAGTLRFSFRSSTVAAGKRQVDMTTDGVAAFTPNSFHEANTIVRSRLDRSPQTRTMERSELEAVGRKAAWRVPHMAWQCESVPDTSLNATLLALELSPRSARFIGTTTVDAISAIRISTQASIYPWTGNQIDTVEVDVDQSSGLPLRVTATVRTRLHGLKATQTLSETYSNFGAAVRIALPRRCS